MSRTATAMQNGMLVVNELPGLQSVASATVAPASMSRLASGYRARVENSAPGQQRGDGGVCGACERFDVVVGGIGAVIHRGGAELDREPDTRAGAELAGVQPRVEPGGHSGCEDVTGFVDVERAAIAEHIHPAGVRRAGLQHRAGDQVDVGRAVVAELCGNDVRAEECRLVGDGPGDPQRAGLVVDGQPVAALAFEGGDPGAKQFVGEPLDSCEKCRVVGRPCRGYRRRDPARPVGLAAHPRRELGGPFAREHQMRMAVDESGDHAGVGATDSIVGVRRVGAAAHPHDLCAVDHQRRVGDDAQRVAVAVRGVVGDQLTDVGVEHGHRAASTGASIRSAMAEASSASTSGTVTCLRSTTTARPSTTTSVTSGAAAAKTTFSTVAPPPAVRIESICTATKSARAPTDELTGVRPAEGVMAIVGRGPQQAVGGDGAARAGGEAFVEFDGTGLFEQIDHGVAVGAEAEQSASGEQCGRGPDAVAEVAFGGGAEAHPGRRPIKVGDVLGCQVGGVHGRRPRPQCADVAQHCGRRAAVHREALLDFAGLLRGMDVQRNTVRSAHSTTAGMCSTGTPLTECRAAPTRTDGSVPTCCRSASTRSAHRSPVPSPNRC